MCYAPQWRGKQLSVLVFFGNSSKVLREFFGKFPKPPRRSPEASPKKTRSKQEGFLKQGLQNGANSKPGQMPVFTKSVKPRKDGTNSQALSVQRPTCAKASVGKKNL